jgi:hypothetical protein
MKRTHYLFAKAILVIVVCLGLAYGHTNAVQADTCTWTGSTSADWDTATNWDCSDGTPHVPITTDNVVIPNTSNDPVYSETLGFDLNAIEIQAGATLTIANTSNIRLDANIWQIDGTLWFYSTDLGVEVEINRDTPEGLVNVDSTGDVDLDIPYGLLQIYSTYNNDGMLECRPDAQGIALMGSGVHTGEFADLPVLQLAAVDPEAEFVFQLDSVLTLNLLNVTSGHAFIYGSYQPWGTSTRLNIDASNRTYPPSVTIESTSVTMPEYTMIYSGSTLAVRSPLSMPRLFLAGTLNNTSSIDVTGSFYWLSGGFTGDGTTTVQASATSTINLNSTATMDAQTLTLASTTNWDGNNITLSNNSEMINNGTFNANATTTMAGVTGESFVNNGSFLKKTVDTTTTMNIPFINDGTVDIVAGSLIFQQGMDNGANAVVDLGGGTLDPGDELIIDSDDSLIGSGTLAANLVNEGTVSPGNSAGIITVQGDYSNLNSGLLQIELGGTTAGTEHDQLVVTGTATMNGTLTVTLLPGFLPELGETFFIIDHTIGTLTFDTVNLPNLAGGLKLEADFSNDGVTLTVVRASADTFIFLPMILR